MAKYPLCFSTPQRKTPPAGLENHTLELQKYLARFTVQNQKPLKETLILLVQDWASHSSAFLCLLGQKSNSAFLGRPSGEGRDIPEEPHYHKRCKQNKQMSTPVFIDLILPSRSSWQRTEGINRYWKGLRTQYKYLTPTYSKNLEL